MKGDPEASNAIWLLNWRKALDRAKKTGGRCVQIIVQGGLSEMQEADAESHATLRPYPNRHLHLLGSKGP